MLKSFFEQNNIEYAQNISLKDISSFKIGGEAKIICYPKSAREVSQIVVFCNQSNIKYLTFGKCSNVLFCDSGIKKLIIKTDKINHINKVTDGYEFGAGVMLAKASKTCVDSGYSGMEFSYGIPGSIGGAVYMNAGAYGGEMKQVVSSVEYVDESGNVCVIDNNGLDFSYRHSFFSNKNYIITSVTVKLQKGDINKSLDLINEYQTARKTKQPLEFPSAGSVFKRPDGYFAGKLIQDSNLRGYSIGGAQVSEKHCGFIINKGDATAKDVLLLIDFIKDTVYKNFNVELECELKYIQD